MPIKPRELKDNIERQRVADEKRVKRGVDRAADLKGRAALMVSQHWTEEEMDSALRKMLGTKKPPNINII
jgi:hypothetical protein